MHTHPGGVGIAQRDNTAPRPSSHGLGIEAGAVARTDNAYAAADLRCAARHYCCTGFGVGGWV